MPSSYSQEGFTRRQGRRGDFLPQGGGRGNIRMHKCISAPPPVGGGAQDQPLPSIAFLYFLPLNIFLFPQRVSRIFPERDFYPHNKYTRIARPFSPEYFTPLDIEKNSHFISMYVFPGVFNNSEKYVQFAFRDLSFSNDGWKKIYSLLS